MEIVHNAFDEHKKARSKSAQSNARLGSILDKVAPGILKTSIYKIDSGSDDNGYRYVFDYGDPIPASKFDELLQYMRSSPEHGQFGTAILVSPSGAGKSFSATYLAKSGKQVVNGKRLYTIPFSDKLLSELAQGAENEKIDWNGRPSTEFVWQHTCSYCIAAYDLRIPFRRHKTASCF